MSTVISTLLMIMVAMVGMTVAFASVVVYADIYKNGIGGSVLESLTVEDIYQTANHQLVVTVYNAATSANLGSDIDVKVTAIYVDGGLSLINKKGTADMNSNYGQTRFDEQTVKAGAHMSFIGEPPAGQYIQPGAHIVTVSTQRGSNFNGQFTAP
ncbi:MAG: hypothetical protein ACQCN6_02645 [Candidatus Bathyarchaeia archaeon]